MTLSDEKLLERCVLGTTQNPNECVNSMVWVQCPKHKHHGVKVVRWAVASAACHFHSAAKSRLRVMERQASTKEKKRRQGEKLLRTRREEALREADGVTLFSFIFAALKFRENFLGTFRESLISRSQRKIVFTGN